MEKGTIELFQCSIARKSRCLLDQISHSDGISHNLTLLSSWLMADPDMDSLLRSRVRVELAVIARKGRRRRLTPEQEVNTIRKQIRGQIIKVIKREYKLRFRKEIRQEKIDNAIDVDESSDEARKEVNVAREDVCQVDKDQDEERQEKQTDSLGYSEKKNVNSRLDDSRDKFNPLADNAIMPIDTPKTVNEQIETIRPQINRNLSQVISQTRPLFELNPGQPLKVDPQIEKSDRFGHFLYGDTLLQILDKKTLNQKTLLLLQWNPRKNGQKPYPTLLQLQDFQDYRPLQAQHYINTLKQHSS